MPPRWTKSLRFQLTAWSLTTTAAILLPAAALSYGLVGASLRREADQALAGAAAQTLRAAAPADAAESGEPDDRPSPRAAVLRATLAPVVLPGIGADPICLRLAWAGTGRAAALSPVLAARPDLQAALGAMPARPTPPVFAGGGDDDQVRVLAVAVAGTPFLLQAAVPWDPAQDLLERLRAGLALASALFLLLSGCGSWLLVGRALRPIDRIATEAGAMPADGRPPVLLRADSSDGEIGHLVASLNRMLARIADTLAAQRRFTADASHEMRTPLTILRGEFELALSRERPPGEYRHTLESGLEEVERLARIVESLGFLARGDAGSPLPRLPVALRPLLAGAVGALAGRARARGVEVVLDAPQDAETPGDADALERMARNLIENAITYTPPGGRVTVSLAAPAGGASACRITVRDTGPGIAPEDLPRVFERFFRADKARANTGGAGLGLSIVQSIVRAHGGRVSAESEEGKGSRFVVELPAR